MKHLHPLVVECWAAHEALTRLGFKTDDVFVVSAILPGTSAPGPGVMVRDRDGREFTLIIGVFDAEMSADEFCAAWLAFLKDDYPRASEAELEAAWESSKVRRESVQLVAALHVKGLRVPGREN